MAFAEGGQWEIVSPAFNFGRTVLEAGTIGGSFVSGKISIGYAAQEPWMRSATIRENILFGADFDEARYEQVFQACALKEDLNSFEKGDETVVGERHQSIRWPKAEWLWQGLLSK